MNTVGKLLGLYDFHYVTMWYTSIDIHTWLRAAAGAGGESLKQDTIGFLFRLLLFHWRFPIYLSDQVIEDLRKHNHNKERKLSGT